MRFSLVLAVLTALGAGGAAAEITYSPPVRSDMGDNLGCKLLNLGDAAVEVTSELENGLGTVVDSQTFVVPVGESRLMARSNTAIFGGFCRFTFEGAASQVRGYITLEDAGGSNTRLLYPASEAAPPAPTPTPGGGCCGDCDLDGEVFINELIVAVTRALDGCPE